MLYLLQLVQALKFETPPGQSPSSSIRHSRHASSHRFPPPPPDNLPTLADFLIERSARNPVLGNHFHWYIAVECEDKQRGKMFVDVAKKFDKRVAEVCFSAAPFVRVARLTPRNLDSFKSKAIPTVASSSAVKPTSSRVFRNSPSSFAIRKMLAPRKSTVFVPSSTTLAPTSAPSPRSPSLSTLVFLSSESTPTNHPSSNPTSFLFVSISCAKAGPTIPSSSRTAMICARINS
jgi:hypothetical protein